MLLASLSLALCPAAVSAPARLPFASADLPYAELAERFLADHGLTGSSPDEVVVSAILERDFFSTRIGQFEVCIPRVDLEDKETANDYRDVCAALCASQRSWVGWLGEHVADQEELLDDLEELEKWVDKWKVAKLRELGEESPRNALDLFKASDEVRKLSGSLAQRIQSGGVLGVSLEAAAPVQLALMPRRKSFVEFLCFAGWILPDYQASFWAPGISSWTEFRLDGLQVIALEYPPHTTPVEGDYENSSSMKDRDVTGLEQQVVQLAMNQLLAYQHGDALPSGVISGLTIEMLIELYGACHTRNDGDMRARETHAREIFIAGGQSEGGRLPQNIAESRWRTDYGKHHYTRILKQVQKSGASSDKRNRHKYNSFLLVGDNESDRFVVHAPVYGPSAGSEQPPAGIRGDYLEFLRAYNVAFMHWLRVDAAGGKKDSAQAFARLMAKITADDTEATFAEALEEVYGSPLTHPEVDTDCLEGRFIKWLSKQ